MLIKGKCFADFRIYGNSWHNEAPVVAPGTTAHVESACLDVKAAAVIATLTPEELSQETL